MAETIEKTEQEKNNEKLMVALKKFCAIEPDPAETLFKISKFATFKPEDYKLLKNLLDKEVLKIIKSQKKNG